MALFAKPLPRMSERNQNLDELVSPPWKRERDRLGAPREGYEFLRRRRHNMWQVVTAERRKTSGSK